MISKPDIVKNDELWIKRCRQVRALAKRIIAGETGMIEGSLQMLRFKLWLQDRDEEDFRVFSLVASKSHHLPIGQSRLLWDSDALTRKDAESAALENLYRTRIVEAAARIQAKYGQVHSGAPDSDGASGRARPPGPTSQK